MYHHPLPVAQTPLVLSPYQHNHLSMLPLADSLGREYAQTQHQLERTNVAHLTELPPGEPLCEDLTVRYHNKRHGKGLRGRNLAC